LATHAESAIRQYAIEALKSFDNDAVGAAALLLSDLPGPRLDLLAELQIVDEALASLSIGRGDLVLALPTSVRRAVEASCTTSSVGTTRVLLHWRTLTRRVHVLDDRAGYWIDAAKTLRAFDPSLAVNWLIRARRLDEADLALDDIASSGEMDLLRIARASLIFSLATAGRLADVRRHAIAFAASYDRSVDPAFDEMLRRVLQTASSAARLDAGLEADVAVCAEFIHVLVERGLDREVELVRSSLTAEVSEQLRLQGDD
jgi:hypothetical protein